MRYEFTRIVADNLRFGLYKDGKVIKFDSDHSVTIIDINSNTYIHLSVTPIESWQVKTKSIFSRPELVSVDDKNLSISVQTGTPNPVATLTYQSYAIQPDHKDYTFWKEFKTFIEAAYNDKIYKHKTTVEEAFFV